MLRAMAGGQRVFLVWTGDRYSEIYLDRMLAMVRRCIDVAEPIQIFSDQPLEPRPNCEYIDARPWRLRGFFNKLRLFDREITGETPFLYLDVTAVLWQSLEPLVEWGYAQEKDLICVQDWGYPCLNTSVMLIRPSDLTQTIWDRFAAGEQFDQPIPGDQNWVDAVVKSGPLAAETATWPEGWVESFKRLRKRHARQPGPATQALGDLYVLKFHGYPKMQEALSPPGWIKQGPLRHPLQPRTWGFLLDEVRQRWR